MPAIARRKRPHRLPAIGRHASHVLPDKPDLLVNRDLAVKHVRRARPGLSLCKKHPRPRVPTPFRRRLHARHGKTHRVPNVGTDPHVQIVLNAQSGQNA